METILETIQVGLASDASSEQRDAAANACRAIVASLQPAPPTETPAAPDAPQVAANIAALAAAIRTVPLDQLLDVAIAKLRAALPAQTATPQVDRLNIPLIRVPRP